MQPFPSSPGNAAGWYPDPAGQFEYRWFNGERWTADVSTHGQRFVDPRSLAPAPYSYPPTNLPLAGRTPKRGLAVASFVLGLSALATAWLPFVFVLAGIAAVLGFVFGLLALGRVRRGEGGGGNLAGWGIAASVAAAALCVVGFFLTRDVIRELDRLFDPGPYATTVDRCDTNNGLITFDGRIENLDDVYHDYTVFVRFTDGADDLLEFDTVTVRRVPPGESGALHATAFADATTVRCEIYDVQGVSP